MSAQLMWKAAKILIPFIIGAIIGGMVVGKAKQVQIDAGKVELSKTQQELVVCQDANKTNQETITSLQMELRSAQQSCTTRLREKERTVNEIKQIDSLKPGVTANETNNNNGGNSGDPILDSLNRMFIPDRQPAGSQN